MSKRRVSGHSMLHLEPGDVVAFQTIFKGQDNHHWGLGSVESVLQNVDIEVRLWQKKTDDLNEKEIANTPAAQELKTRIKSIMLEIQKRISATENLVSQVRKSRVELFSEIEKVEQRVTKSKAAVHSARKGVEEIRDLSWNELKSYRRPPQAVLLVVRAVMLLLSEDEARTWMAMRRVMQDSNFRHRILRYDPELQLSSYRSTYILQECLSKKEFNYESVVQGSAALGAIYYWVLAQLDYNEAVTQKQNIEHSNEDQRNEYIALLNELSQEEGHIAELQETEQELIDRLQLYSVRATTSTQDEENRRRRDSLHESADKRYQNSFAGKAGLEFLRGAFYGWVPTNRVTFVKWDYLLTEFGSTIPRTANGGYFLAESQVRALGEALKKGGIRLASLDRDPSLGPEEDRVSRTSVHVPVTDRFHRRIEGDRWRDVLVHKRREIEHALREDTAQCLQIALEKVTIVSAKAGSLLVEVDVEHDGSRKRNEIQQSINEYNYPTVMALYGDKEEAMLDCLQTVSSTGRMEDFPRRRVRVPGEHWCDLLQKHHTLLTSAILKDISEAAATDKDKIRLLNVHANKGGPLELEYVLADHSLDMVAVEDMCEAYAFPHSSALDGRYNSMKSTSPERASSQEPPFCPVRSSHGRRRSIRRSTSVQSENWVREERPEAASGREPEPEPEPEPQPKRPTMPSRKVHLSEGTKKNAVDLSTDAISTATGPLTDAVVYNKNKAVYVKNFDGSYWSAAVRNGRLALAEAFCSDTATALGLLARQIEIYDMGHTAAQLEVKFTILSNTLSPKTVESRIDTYEYPEVWSLYNEIVYNQRTPVGNFKRIFDGSEWTPILLNQKEQLEEAFIQDVCEAMGISPSSVSVQSITSDTHSVIVYYAVPAEGDFAHDVDYALKEYEFPHVWGLYENRRKILAEGVKTGGMVPSHSDADNLTCFFEGDAWRDIMKNSRSLIEAAFREDEARCLSVPQNKILVRSIEATPEGLIIVYAMQGTEHTRREIEVKSGSYQYPKLWKLYQVPNVATHHQVVFEGPHWRRVLDSHKAEFEAAFAACTAEPFGLKSRDIQNVMYTFGSLVVDFDMIHSDSLSKATIDEKLLECPYEPLWELYRKQLPDSHEGPIATTHTLSFEGENWQDVFQKHGLELHQAIQLDTAEVLNLPKNDIDGIRMFPAKHTLGAQFTAHHPPSKTESQIELALSKCDYMRVWELYRSFSPPPTRYAKPVLPLIPLHTEEQTRAEPPQVNQDELGSSALDTKTGTYVCGGSKYLRSGSGYQASDLLPRRGSAQNTSVQWAESSQVDSTSVPQRYFDPSTASENASALGSRGLQIRNAVGVAVAPRKIDHTKAVAEGRVGLVQCFEGTDWNIWIDESASSANQTSLSPEFSLVFEGKGWDYVIRNRYGFLKDAFCEEASRALGNIAKEDICDTSFSMHEEESMNVRFHLPKALMKDLTEEDARARLEAYPYRKVWILYEEPGSANLSISNARGGAVLDGEVMSAHNVGFEGTNWEFIGWMNHDKIVEAFRRDTARATGVHVDSVTVDEVNLYPNLLHLRAKLRHSTGVTSSVLNERMLQYDYAEIWRLYEELPEGQESGLLVKVFQGDHWGPIIANNPGPLAEAFCTGVSRCLKIPRACVKVVNLNPGSLVVEYTVRSCSLSDAEIQHQTAAYSHPEVWSFYEYIQMTNAVKLDLISTACATTLQRTFKGNRWGLLVTRWNGTLQSLFLQETSSILNVSQREIHVISLYSTDQCLVVHYRVNSTKSSQSNSQKLVNKAEYSALWSFYRSYDYPNFTRTLHDVHFKGQRWVDLLEHDFQILMNTFALCTIETLGLERWCVDDLRVELDPHSRDLNFCFALQHPSTMSSMTIDHALKKCPYDELWALHRTGPPARNDQVKAAVSVPFTGSGWRTVSGAKWAELRQVFIQDVASSLGVARGDVTEVSIQRMESGIHLSAEVVKPTIWDVKLLQNVLDRSALPNVCSIGARHHHSNQPDSIGSIHRLDFEADRWSEVMKYRREMAFNALCIDAAAALRLPIENVEILSMEAFDDRLQSVVIIMHPQVQTVGDIQERLSAFSYTQMWALYEDAVEPHVDVLKTRGEQTNPAVTVKRLDEELPPKDFIRRLRNAFVEDTASALKCHPMQIVIDGIQLARLNVHYHLTGDGVPKGTDQLVQNWKYPNLKALLGSCKISAVDTQPGHSFS